MVALILTLTIQLIWTLNMPIATKDHKILLIEGIILGIRLVLFANVKPVCI